MRKQIAGTVLLALAAACLVGCTPSRPTLTRDEWLDCAKDAVNAVLETEEGRDRLLDLSEAEAKKVMLEIGVDACGESPS